MIVDFQIQYYANTNKNLSNENRFSFVSMWWFVVEVTKDWEPVHLVQVAVLEGVGEPLRQTLELRRVHVVAGDLADGCHWGVLGQGQRFPHAQGEEHLLLNAGGPSALHVYALGLAVEGYKGFLHGE